MPARRLRTPRRTYQGIRTTPRRHSAGHLRALRAPRHNRIGTPTSWPLRHRPHAASARSAFHTDSQFRQSGDVDPPRICTASISPREPSETHGRTHDRIRTGTTKEGHQTASSDCGPRPRHTVGAPPTIQTASRYGLPVLYSHPPPLFWSFCYCAERPLIPPPPDERQRNPGPRNTDFAFRCGTPRRNARRRGRLLEFGGPQRALH